MEVSKIFITYRTKKLEKLCNSKRDANREYGTKVGSKLIKRRTELEAFPNLQMIPSNLPFRREKLTGKENVWLVRIDQEFRIEFKVLDKNDDLRLVKSIEIVEVSKHYE